MIADSMIFFLKKLRIFCPNPCKYILRDGASTLWSLEIAFGIGLFGLLLLRYVGEVLL